MSQRQNARSTACVSTHLGQSRPSVSENHSAHYTSENGQISLKEDTLSAAYDEVPLRQSAHSFSGNGIQKPEKPSVLLAANNDRFIACSTLPVTADEDAGTRPEQQLDAMPHSPAFHQRQSMSQTEGLSQQPVDEHIPIQHHQRHDPTPARQSVVEQGNQPFEALHAQRIVEQPTRRTASRKTGSPPRITEKQRVITGRRNLYQSAYTNLTLTVSDAESSCPFHCHCPPEYEYLYDKHGDTAEYGIGDIVTQELSEKQLDEIEERIKQRREELKKKSLNEAGPENNMQLEPPITDTMDIQSVTSVRIRYCGSHQCSPCASPSRIKVNDQLDVVTDNASEEEKESVDRNTSHGRLVNRQFFDGQSEHVRRKHIVSFRKEPENNPHNHVPSSRQYSPITNMQYQQQQNHHHWQPQHHQRQGDQQKQHPNQQQQKSYHHIYHQKQNQQHAEQLQQHQQQNAQHARQQACLSHIRNYSELQRQPQTAQRYQRNIQQLPSPVRHCTNSLQKSTYREKNLDQPVHKSQDHIQHKLGQYFGNNLNSPKHQGPNFERRQQPMYMYKGQQPMYMYKGQKQTYVKEAVPKKIVGQTVKPPRPDQLRRYRSQSPAVRNSRVRGQQLPRPRSQPPPHGRAVSGGGHYFNENAHDMQPADGEIQPACYNAETMHPDYPLQENEEDLPQPDYSQTPPVVGSGMIYRHHPYKKHGAHKMPMYPDESLIVTVGGLNPKMVHPEIPCRLMDSYYTATNTWTLLGKLPEARHHHGCVMLDGYLYLIGGSLVIEEDLTNMSLATSSCYRFDFGGNFWTAIAPMSRPRMYHSVTVLEGVIYAMGGETSQAQGEHCFLDTCEYYNPDTDEWGPIANMMDGTIGAAITGFRGVVWVIGGFVERDKERLVLGTVECYDPRTNSWVTMNPLPIPVCHACVVDIMDTLFLVGGAYVRDQDLPVVSRGDILQYLEKEDVWVHYSSLSVPRHDAACCVMGTYLFVLGGFCSITSEILDEVECVDVSTGEWFTDLEPLCSPALGLACVSIIPEDFEC